MDHTSSRAHRARGSFSSLRLWFGRPLLRTYELRFYPQFWQLRNQWRRLSFRLGKLGYSVRGGAITAAESTSILFLIARTVIWQAIGGVVLVAVLEMGDKKLRGPLVHLGWLAQHLPRVGAALIRIRHVVPEPAITPGTLSTIAQIAGLFLGLYFTAISVVAGTNYARVPAEVLDALVREKVGNLYIRVVAFFGGVALMLLVATNLGYRPGALNLFAVSALGIASVLSFVELGRRAFYFFDPTRLVKFVANDVFRAVRGATAGGFRWQDPSFQDHYRRQADADIRIYEDVILLSDQESRLQGRSLVALVSQFLALLEFYARLKNRIPSTSSWFERKYRHRTWLTSEDTRVNLAIDTGTSLDPEYVPDHAWIEKRVGNLVWRALRGLLERNDLSRAITVAIQLQETVGTLGRELALDESLSLVQGLKTFIHDLAMKTKTELLPPPEQTQQLSTALGLVDICAMGFISSLVNFANRIHEISLERFSASVDSVNFRRPRSIYSTGLPRKVVEQLEYLQKGTMFEVKVEGRQISPEWYCRQIAALGFARFFVEACGKLIAELESAYAVQAESLSAKGKHAFAAQLVQRGLEACHKFHFHIDRFDAWFRSLSELRRVPDIPWPTFGAKSAHERVESVRSRILIVLANSVPGIAALPSSSEIPDYVGQIHVMLADECYRSMAAGDEVLFGKLFAPFFAVAIAARDRLRLELREADTKTAVAYLTTPIEDLLAISGYALVYSELDSKNFWNVVKGLWDNFLTKTPNPKAAVESLLNTILYRRSLFAILPRDLRRTAWSQDLFARLRARGIGDAIFDSPGFGINRGRNRHPSPLIRALGRMSSLFEKPADIFLGVYLVPRPEAAGSDIPRSVADFTERLEREKLRGPDQSETTDETT